MRQRIKQTLSQRKDSNFFLRRKTNTKLLHSDKSTYFGPLSGRKVSNLQRPVLFSPEKRGFREKMMSYVGITQTHNAYFCKGFAYSSTVPLVLASLALLLVLGCMINPVVDVTEKVSAVGQDFGYGRTVSLSIINNGATLTDNETVTADTTPGVVSYIDNTIRINTSKIAKYYVGVQAAVDGNSNLVGSKYGETIAGVGNNVSPDRFDDNTWGYSLTDNMAVTNNALTYSTLPAYNANSPLQYTSAANPSDGNHDLKLTFAAKINANKPGDHYQTKAMVSVAADAKTLPTLNDITKMQEMTAEHCAGSTIGQSKTLTDSRDSSTYIVKKLGDGKCWMGQNLRLVNKVLTPADSDVASNYTLPSSVSPWNDTAINTNKVYYDSDHDYFGAYYSWYAATAGTGTISSGNASSSVCPKGWRLPTGGTNGDFQTLYNAGHEKYGDFVSGYSNGSGYFLGGAASASNSFFFVAAGNVAVGNLYNHGSNGLYWSSTASSDDKAVYLNFGNDYLFTSAADPKNIGCTVRCVAK